MAWPAQGQFVSIPVTNGSFALTLGAAGNQYAGPITLLSPAGTIAITNAAQPIYQAAFSITTNTPIGVYLTNVSGSANLNDGRTATLNGNGAAKLETLATVTGAANYIASTLIPVGATVSFNVVSGSFDIPQAALSAYPTPQVVIPITGGSFSINAPAGAGFETLTINSVLTPLGTANLTLTYPLLTAPGSTFPYIIQGATQVQIGGLVNGSIALNDGRTANVNNRVVVWQGTAQVTTPAPNNLYQFPAVYLVPITLTGSVTSGSISIPESDVISPAPPVVPPPVVLPPPSDTIPSPPITPPSIVPPPQPVFQFAQTTFIDLDTNDLTRWERQRALIAPQDIPESEQSALKHSRIHPALQATE
ncbi:hypothetical protein [Leptodesmis sichuanensis]|uniref:hypothetical protein n=1 Tax=Leptodesmis sichuanensis TaxID=2906798 RepID=UPI001F31FD80|nr:hypothetical protein [Leptodesmis sichuanensis]UIE39288.1 hypothetical protein KIK02_06830 [Leptodesmis sichuanensis A121]